MAHTVFNTASSIISNSISKCLLIILNGYQKFVSPSLPARCRYYPTCSEYSKHAIQWHGAHFGTWLTLKRLARCHPFASSGIDFVPLPLYQYIYFPTNPNLINSSDLKAQNFKVVSCETLLWDRGVYKDTSSYTVRMSACLKTLQP